MTMQDSLGNAVTTTSPEALRQIDAAIDLHARAWPGALDAARQATEQDPDLAIGHALQALIHAIWARRPAAQAAMSEALARAGRTSPRERSLIELLDHAIRGRTHSALAWLLAHLRRWPTDMLALTTGMGAYGSFAFSGRADHNEQRLMLLDELEREYPRDHAWLLAYRGWARIELGAVDEGLAMARHAIGMRPQNAHNAHIVAHGFHEAGRGADYLDFLATWLPDYPDDALMWGHLQWHGALAELALGRDDAAVQRCAEHIMPGLARGAPFMGLADSASLLWRLGLHGRRELPWSQAAKYASDHFPKGSNAFGEVHLAMLAAVQRDMAALAACRERLERLAGEGYLGATAAAAWTSALKALIDGDAQEGDRQFEACEADAVRFGGSTAQRSIVGATRKAQRVPLA